MSGIWLKMLPRTKETQQLSQIKHNTTNKLCKTKPCSETKSQHAVLLTKPADLASTACFHILHELIPDSHKTLQMRECLQRESKAFSLSREDRSDDQTLSWLSPSPQKNRGSLMCHGLLPTSLDERLKYVQPRKIALAKYKQENPDLITEKCTIPNIHS